LAETRGIARALRFAGYGVEYCSAEEVSHLENGNGKPAENSPPAQNPSYKASNGGNGNGNDNYKKPSYSKGNGGGNGNNGGNGGSNGGNGGNGNGGGRLSPKQYKYLIMLSEEKNVSYEALNQKSIDTYGTVLEHLSKANASSFIQELQAQ